MIAKGTHTLEDSKNSLVRQDAGMVAGATEEFTEEKISLGEKTSKNYFTQLLILKRN